MYVAVEGGDVRVRGRGWVDGWLRSHCWAFFVLFVLLDNERTVVRLFFWGMCV